MDFADREGDLGDRHSWQAIRIMRTSQATTVGEALAQGLDTTLV